MNRPSIYYFCMTVFVLAGAALGGYLVLHGLLGPVQPRDEALAIALGTVGGGLVGAGAGAAVLA